MRVVEESYLLLTNEAGGPESSGSTRRIALTAALLADLVLAERVAISSERPPHVEVLSARPVGDPVLDARRAALPRRPEPLSEVVRWAALDPEDDVVGRFLVGGVLGEGKRTLFGFGPRTMRMVDPRPKRRVRMRLADVLERRVQATSADVALLSILLGLYPGLQGVRTADGLLPPASGAVSHGETMDLLAGLLGGWPPGAALVGVLQQVSASAVHGGGGSWGGDAGGGAF